MSLTLQLHPDWPFRGGMVLEALARDGVYRSQFETGTSNGGLTAHVGGDRWRWESRLFAGRYDDGPASARPVYGAWNRRDDPYGGAIRFGSAHLRLRPHVLERATFCYPDSFGEPDDYGGPEVLDALCVLADRGVADGVDDLDEYVEAQVHGGVRLADDVEAVVLDPCFRDGPVHEAADRLGCAVEWHPGFRVATSGLDEAYRGPEFVALARELGAELVPATIGDAARAGGHDPRASSESGTCSRASGGPDGVASRLASLAPQPTPPVAEVRGAPATSLEAPAQPTPPVAEVRGAPAQPGARPSSRSKPPSATSSALRP